MIKKSAESILKCKNKELEKQNKILKRQCSDLQKENILLKDFLAKNGLKFEDLDPDYSEIELMKPF